VPSTAVCLHDVTKGALLVGVYLGSPQRADLMNVSTSDVARCHVVRPHEWGRKDAARAGALWAETAARFGPCTRWQHGRAQVPGETAALGVPYQDRRRGHRCASPTSTKGSMSCACLPECAGTRAELPVSVIRLIADVVVA